MIELTTKRPMPTDEQVAKWLLAHGWTETDLAPWQKPHTREFANGHWLVRIPRSIPENNAAVSRSVVSQVLNRVAYVHGMSGSLELYEEMTATTDAEVKP